VAAGAGRTARVVAWVGLALGAMAGGVGSAEPQAGPPATGQAPPMALVEAGQAPPMALVEAGRGIYLRNCSPCHGVEAHGDGPVAAALAARPPDLTAIARRRGGTFPAGEIASVIDGRFEVAAHGSRTMPVWGRVLGEPISDGTTADEVSRGRIDALVAYLQSIQEAPEATTPGGAPAR